MAVSVAALLVGTHVPTRLRTVHRRPHPQLSSTGTCHGKTLSTTQTHRPPSLEPIDPQSQPFLPIKAYFIGTEIDIVKLYQAAIGGPDKYTLRKDTVVASFDDGEGYAFSSSTVRSSSFDSTWQRKKSCLQSAVRTVRPWSTTQSLKNFFVRIRECRGYMRWTMGG